MSQLDKKIKILEDTIQKDLKMLEEDSYIYDLALSQLMFHIAYKKLLKQFKQGYYSESFLKEVSEYFTKYVKEFRKTSTQPIEFKLLEHKITAVKECIKSYKSICKSR